MIHGRELYSAKVMGYGTIILRDEKIFRLLWSRELQIQPANQLSMENGTSGEEARTYEIKEFYDQFSEYQKKSGANLRILRVLGKCIGEGLKGGVSVLEIGCGTGELTNILAKKTSGKVVGTDISPKAIATAKSHYGKRSNLEFRTNEDAKNISNEKYDFIILADVLEHIPTENHEALFHDLGKLMNDKSKILINIPNPFLISWMRKHDPGSLQIIDQSLFAAQLTSAIEVSGLLLDRFENYSIYHRERDYTWMVVVKRPLAVDYHPKNSIRKLMEKYWLRMKQMI